MVEHRSPKPRAVGSSPSTPASVPSFPIGLLPAIALALLAALPFVVATHPQMTDYPAHLARYHVMLDAGRTPELARAYSFTWRWSGNLGADILIRPLAALFGLEPAGRLLGGSIAVLTGLGIIAIEWVLRRRVGIGGLLAMAAIWSPAMVLGFLNFTLALALALFAFAAWVALEGKRWREVLFVPIGLAVWLCHLSGWGVLGIMVFGYEWHRRRSWSAFLAPWPLVAPLLPTLLFDSGAGGALSYGHHVLTSKTGLWLRALRDQVEWLDVTSAVLLGGGFCLALALRRIDGRLGWSAIMLAGLSWIVPRHLGGGDFADYRLIAVSLMFGALAIEWRAPRWALWLAPLLFLARLAVTMQAWHAGSARLEPMLAALDRVPRGAVVAGAVTEELGVWGFGPFGHAVDYAVFRKDALTNANFAVPGVHMLQLKSQPPGFVDPSQRIFHFDGQLIRLDQFAPARRADYLWAIVGPGIVGAARTVPVPGMTVIASGPGWFLARLAKPGPHG